MKEVHVENGLATPKGIFDPKPETEPQPHTNEKSNHIDKH
jgi:hypothetical protein